MNSVLAMLPWTDDQTRPTVWFGLVRRKRPPSSPSNRLPPAKASTFESACGAVPPAPLPVTALVGGTEDAEEAVAVGVGRVRAEDGRVEHVLAGAVVQGKLDARRGGNPRRRADHPGTEELAGQAVGEYPRRAVIAGAEDP